MRPTTEQRERIRTLLRAEGAAVFVLGIYLWTTLDMGWVTFVLLFALPDLLILGYLGGPGLGSVAYNAVHTYVGPLLLAAWVVGTGSTSELLVGGTYVWFAHIGLDRTIGAGLKYPTGFGHTHLTALGALEVAPDASK